MNIKCVCRFVLLFLLAFILSVTPWHSGSHAHAQMAPDMVMENMVGPENGPPLSSLPKGNAGVGQLLLDPMTEENYKLIEERGQSRNNFRIFTAFTHFDYIDPIVYPGLEASTHLHMFFGNASLTAHTTEDDILNCFSASQGGTANCSAYWIPALLDRNNEPQYPMFNNQGKLNIENARMHVYYKSHAIADPTKVISPPVGLKMLAGNAKATPSTAQSPDKAGYRCETSNFEKTTEITPYIPLCKAGEFLKMIVKFPHCWDGVNTDSEDHKSHVSFAVDGDCPATHPFPMPKITFNIAFPVGEEGTSGWHLSSDMYEVTDATPGGYSAHGDWFNGWDLGIMDRFISNCTHQEKDCYHGYLNDGEKLSVEHLFNPPEPRPEGSLPASPPAQPPTSTDEDESIQDDSIVPDTSSDDDVNQIAELPESPLPSDNVEDPIVTTQEAPQLLPPSISEEPDIVEPDALLDSPDCRDDRFAERAKRRLERLRERRQSMIERLERLLERLDSIYERLDSLSLSRANARIARSFAQKKTKKKVRSFTAKLAKADRKMRRISNRISDRIEKMQQRVASGEIEVSPGNDCLQKPEQQDAPQQEDAPQQPTEEEQPPLESPSPVPVPSPEPTIPSLSEDPERFDEPDTPSIIVTIPGIELPEMPQSAPDSDDKEPIIKEPEEDAPPPAQDTSSEAEDVLKLTNEQRMVFKL